MRDAPFQIILLCDADKCAINQALMEERNKSTILELEMEYESWFNTFHGVQDSNIRGGLEQFKGYQNSITALVDKDHMCFFPFTHI